MALLTESEHNPHIPECTEAGNFGGPWRLYRMPLYRPLTAKSKEAWRQFKVLRDICHKAWSEAKPAREAQAVNGSVSEAVAADMTLPDSLKQAIEELSYQAGNYGEYMFEFRKGNMAVDQNGILVLLDPLFDLAEVRADMARRSKRIRGY